jgi:CRP/FNR family transcriptional regulator
MNLPQPPLPPLVEFLSHTIIFEHLPVEQLTELSRLAIVQVYNKGDIIFHQGDAGNGFFVVKTGRVKIFKVSSDGKEQILHIIRETEHFAEVPALDRAYFPASAVAIELSEVLFFPRQAFLQLLEQQPTLAINLLKSVARHLRHFSNLIDSLVLREVPTRLAVYLLDLSKQANNAETVELDLPKGQLAARLGTVPETFHPKDGKVRVKGATCSSTGHSS